MRVALAFPNPSLSKTPDAYRFSTHPIIPSSPLTIYVMNAHLFIHAREEEIFVLRITLN